MNIISKVVHQKVLHTIHRKEDFQRGRVDLIDTAEFLQCATLKLPKGTTFKAHKHIWKHGPENVIAQESWVVIRGTVKAFYYDETGELLHTDVLCAGDASFTFYGGHNYEIMEDDTLVYEFKTGPYPGQENDKEFI